MLGADLRYDLGGSDPLVGTRMPDLDLSTAGGTTTGVSALLRTGRGLVLGLDETYTTDPLPGGVTGSSPGPSRPPARMQSQQSERTPVPQLMSTGSRSVPTVRCAGPAPAQHTSPLPALERWFAAATVPTN